MVLHIPIGAFSALFLLELVHLLRPKLSLALGCRIVLIFALISLLPALVFGYLLGATGEYGEEFLNQHANMAWWMAILASFLPMLRGLKAVPRMGLIPYRVALLLTMTLLGLAGHHGGSLTHGSDYLTEHMPMTIKKLLGMAEEESTEAVSESKDEVTFSGNIYPLMKKYCIQCHGPEKQKGDVRLDGLGASVDNDDQLELWDWSLELILEGEMPPKKKAQPAAHEKKVLVDWITQLLEENRESESE